MCVCESPAVVLLHWQMEDINTGGGWRGVKIPNLLGRFPTILMQRFLTLTNTFSSIQNNALLYYKDSALINCYNMDGFDGRFLFLQHHCFTDLCFCSNVRQTEVEPFSS